MSFKLTDEEGRVLVNLAREAVEHFLKTRQTLKVSERLPKKMLEPCGTFVTINTVKKSEKELRGCIGFPYPTTPLAEAVIDSAISAATQDPRFSSMSIKELDQVVFEVSVLTPPEKLEAKNPKDYCTEVKVGEDGLIVEKGVYKGLLLPQVPVEWGWDAQEFLCQCCNKAGLLSDYWLRDGTRVYKFHAIIFEEETPRGKIARRVLSGK